VENHQIEGLGLEREASHIRSQKRETPAWGSGGGAARCAAGDVHANAQARFRAEIEQNVIAAKRLFEDVRLEHGVRFHSPRARSDEALMHLPLLAAYQGVEVPGWGGLAGDSRPLQRVPGRHRGNSRLSSPASACTAGSSIIDR